MNLKKMLKDQRTFHLSGGNRSYGERVENLKMLEKSIIKHRDRILEALHSDLHKPAFEAYATEVGLTLRVLKNTRKKLKKWMKPKRVSSPLFLFGSRGKIYSEPYGQVLIIGPFNYPWLLCMEPLISALAAGNTVIIKPSRNTPATSQCIYKILSEIFPPELVLPVAPDAGVPTSDLIHLPVDYIFFTGSVRVGKIVMAAAAENLVPVTLELGGKSPVIIDSSANLKRAAERIAYAKFSNAGQICVAPDYIYVHEDIRQPFIDQLRMQIREFYGHNPAVSPDYARIISQKELDRLKGLIDPKKLIFGGHSESTEKYMDPTLLYPVSWDDSVMKDEIFGPILPILPYSDLDTVLSIVKSKAKPLAAYIFTENKKTARKFIRELSFGSGCVNEALMQVSSENLPFGGVGDSGMGRYHGKYSFETFSHEKPILYRTTKFSVKLAYPPYKSSIRLLEKFM